MPTGSVPTLTARRTGRGPAGVLVLPFDADHERVLLGPHKHGDLELMFYAEGTGVDRLGDTAFDVRGGDVLLVTPGIVHDAGGIAGARGWAVEFDAAVIGVDRRNPGDPSCSTGRLWWSSPLLTPFVAAGLGPSQACLHIPDDRRAAWVARLQEMEREQAQRADGWQEVLSALLQVSLIELARFTAPHSAGLRDQGETALAQVFELIEQRYSEPLSTADIADAVGLTAPYLTTLVRRRTGRTVLEWILERRMAAARHLLLATDLSVETVARRAGFSESTYFSRRFRAYHGLSPGRWRSAALADAVGPVPG